MRRLFACPPRWPRSSRRPASSPLVLEQAELVGMAFIAWNPAVPTEIDPVHQVGILGLKPDQSFCARGWVLDALPHFVEAARIAVIALQNILAPDTQPPCDPDIDRIFLRQGALTRIRHGCRSGLSRRLVGK